MELVLLLIVFVTAWIKFGLVAAIGGTATIVLLMPNQLVRAHVTLMTPKKPEN